jgi:hypothetical protein
VLWYPTQAKVRLEWGTQPLLPVKQAGLPSQLVYAVDCAMTARENSIKSQPLGMTNWRVAAHLGTVGEGWRESKTLRRPLVGVGAHSVIKLFEEDTVSFSALLLGQADAPGPLDHDLGGVGLGFEDLHGLVEVVGEGHGARV